MPVYATDESGAQLVGEPIGARRERSFDPDAFTAWYGQQPGSANKAFADFYGASRTTFGVDKNGARTIADMAFDNPNWNALGFGPGVCVMSHRTLVGIDLNDAPDLNNNAAVGFDFDAGWTTQRANLHPHTDWVELAAEVVVLGAVAWVSAGTLGPAVAGSMGLTEATVGVTAAELMAGTVVSAAVAGAATSLASGLLHDNLTLQGVLRGALAGALTAGLMQGVSAVVGNVGTVGTIAARTTVQGAVQALMGGNFKDGAIAGLASGLAEAVSVNMKGGIEAALKDGSMTLAEAAAARTFTRVIGSAIRAAANPSDPGQAFASAFMDDVFNQIDLKKTAPGGPGAPVLASAPSPTTSAAFDDDGFLMPGVVDDSLPAAQQMLQLQDRLESQGLSAEEAGLLAFDAVWRDPAQTLSQPIEGSASWSPAELQSRIADVEQVLDQELRAQQAREDSLLPLEDLRVDTGGGGTSAARVPIRAVMNRNFDSALNAAADVLGLLEPLQALQGDLDKLRSLQVESKLNGMRQAMRGAGVSNVPAGYEMEIDANGTRRDYKATLEKLTTVYEDFVRDQRLRANWGENYKTVRIGNSQMTVQEFETRTLRLQQQAANEAFARGKELIATGQLLTKNGDYMLTLGTYVDRQVRIDLRDFGAAEGIADSRISNSFAVNRYIRGSGLVGIPDLRLGTGLLSDVTLSPKDGYTDQLRRWNVIIPNDTVIMRPDQLGGAYVVPRSTIRLPIPGGKKP